MSQPGSIRGKSKDVIIIIDGYTYLEKGSNMVNKNWGWVYLLLTKIRSEKTERQNSSGGNRLNAKNIFQPGN